MPTGYIFGPESLRELNEKLTGLGMTEIKRREYRAKKLVPPRSIQGTEIGYIIQIGEYEVVFWTTFNKKALESAKSDNAWAVYRRDGKAIHFSRPLNRTKNFLENCYMRAKIAIERMSNIPRDSFSNTEMMLIAYTQKGSKRVFWRSKTKNPGTNRYERQSFNCGLSEESRAFLKPIEKRVRKYHKKLRDEGKEPGAARRSRRRWKEER